MDLSKENRVSHLLNEAARCGLQDASLRDVAMDYFTHDSEGEIEDEDSASESEEDMPLVVEASRTEESDGGPPDDGIPNSTSAAEEDAIQRAATLYECKDSPEIRCHCNCRLWDGKPCIDQFDDSTRNEIKLNIMEMTPSEKDLVLLGVISCSINTADTTLSKTQPATERKKNRIRAFSYAHRRICRDTFLYLFNMSNNHLNAVKKHFKENGLVPRKKKSGGRRKTALSLEDIRRVTRFILHYAEQHSLVLPGRVPGFKRDDVKVLPTHLSKAQLWRDYKAASPPGQRVVQLSSFRSLWRQLIPHVVIGKPMSDLCWVCQRNNTHILKAVNIPEAMKSVTLLTQEQHLREAMAERSAYQEMCAASKEKAAQHGLTELGRSEHPPSTFHYSFDFAQQLHYPANPLQPSPVYFKTARKVQLFGIHAEGLSRQVNYLIDEASSSGKGANMVISLLHHFLATYGVGEDELQLHADNCAGQNKNNHMIRYLMWRVVNGLHRSASINFMVAGHTKFAPDWCFGLLKRLVRKTFISSLTDVEAACEASSVCNTSQLVGTQDGQSVVPCYDWASFLDGHFKRIPGLLSLHSFVVSAEAPNVLKVREFSHSVAKLHDIGKGSCPVGLPQVIAPKGLSLERQNYLYSEIRSEKMHIQRLDEALTRRRYGIHLKLSRCEFLQTQIDHSSRHTSSGTSVDLTESSRQPTTQQATAQLNCL
ncbi:hypothetical protein LSAT2_012447 [Lamellibrachia satsuma]|nr:hypothetical protein LSAT2_012447 [Lamellibrachia satsuma]